MLNQNERCYSELIKLKSFKDRFEYLLMDGSVGDITFGWDRYLNQSFYTSKQWSSFRDEMIVRDGANDMGLDGYPIYGKVIVHHLIPLTPEMIIRHDPIMLNPEYVICVSHKTHNAITYGDRSYVERMAGPVERFPNDTVPWRL